MARLDSKIMGNSKHVMCDLIYLDDDNKIIVYKNIDNYTMIHYRKVDSEIIEVNQWNLDNYYRRDNSEYIKKKYNLLLVQGNFDYGAPDSIYNYKEDRYVLEKGIFDIISTDCLLESKRYFKKIDLLKKYGCFLGCFRLYSTKEEDDIIKYTNEITLEEIEYNFSKTSDLYFGLIDVDGTIRDNKLFKGCDFSRITEYIDLSKYPSLEEFKKEVVINLNHQKNEEKKKYYEIIKQKGYINASLYLDEEVIKVLKKKKD